MHAAAREVPLFCAAAAGALSAYLQMALPAIACEVESSAECTARWRHFTYSMQSADAVTSMVVPSCEEHAGNTVTPVMIAVLCSAADCLVSTCNSIHRQGPNARAGCQADTEHKAETRPPYEVASSRCGRHHSCALSNALAQCALGACTDAH
jgi:hypothetical protein